jgi:hypothetical protein
MFPIEIEIPMKREEFNVKLHKYVKNYEMQYIDAIIQLCEENEIDIEDVGLMLDERTKLVVEDEFRSMNMLPKINQLPL